MHWFLIKSLRSPGAFWPTEGTRCGNSVEKMVRQEEGASRQSDSVPVLLRQPQSRGKGMAADPGTFVILESTQPSVVESRPLKATTTQPGANPRATQATQSLGWCDLGPGLLKAEPHKGLLVFLHPHKYLSGSFQ